MKHRSLTPQLFVVQKPLFFYLSSIVPLIVAWNPPLSFFNNWLIYHSPLNSYSDNPEFLRTNPGIPRLLDISHTIVGFMTIKMELTHAMQASYSSQMVDFTPPFRLYSHHGGWYEKKLYHHYIQLVGYIQITSKPWLQSLKNPQNILW